MSVVVNQPVQKRIGNWLVSHETERYRIFPKNRRGDSIPVWRHNVFIYLRCTLSGGLVVFKHFLHQKQWLWRDSREKGLVCESDVLKEVARMLGVGPRTAQDVVLAAKLNREVPHGGVVTG